MMAADSSAEKHVLLEESFFPHKEELKPLVLGLCDSLWKRKESRKCLQVFS